MEEKEKEKKEVSSEECTSEETIHPDGRKDVKIVAPNLVFNLFDFIKKD